ncbi:MAG TPA: aminoacyl-tRNA deacylase [Chloroflexota bacterium]
MQVPKTNAMRALDARRVPYEALTYDEAIHSAVGVALALGLPANQVYKTLVVLRERGRPLLVMVPGNAEIDLRRLARSMGEKRLQMAPHREAERLTGLKVGGIGALALLGKPFDVAIDRSALALDRILVNGGRRGLNLRLRVADLIEVTRARVVDAIDAAPDPDGPSTDGVA